MTKFKIQKSKKVISWLRILLSGPPKTGKTLLALSAPKVLLIDVEGGARAYGDAFDFDVVEVRSYTETMAILKEIEAGEHPQYETIVLDSGTRIFNNLRDAQLESLRAKARKYGKEYDESLGLGMQGNTAVNNKMKTLSEVIERLKVNVVVIAHESDVLKADGRGGFEKIGVKPDIDKKAEYAYDYLLRTEKGDSDYFVTITGGRTLEKGFVGKRFKNANWDKIFGELAKKIDKDAGTVPDNAAGVELDTKAIAEVEKQRAVLNAKRAMKTRIISAYLLTESDFDVAVAAARNKGADYDTDAAKFEEMVKAEAALISKGSLQKEFEAAVEESKK